MQQSRTHMMDIFFALALFCVLVVTVLLVVLLGANVYKNVNADMTRNYELRTSLLYITQKVRQMGAQGVSVGQVDGGDALVLRQRVNGDTYETWIYAADGALCEVSVRAGTPVKAGDGQRIMALAGFSLKQETPNLVRVEVIDSSQHISSALLRAAQGGA
nr:DUF4860 domain-containing protein [Maliibacterium massiliense]